MSPEQVRGEPVEADADVWAFGCVLYEMLAGRSAIARGTRRETLEQILEGEPDFTLLPASTPPLVSRLVRRCLEKDRRTRLRHIADARAYLDDAITIPSGAYEGTAVRARRMGGWFVVLPALT